MPDELCYECSRSYDGVCEDCRQILKGMPTMTTPDDDTTPRSPDVEAYEKAREDALHALLDQMGAPIPVYIPGSGVSTPEDIEAYDRILESLDAATSHPTPEEIEETRQALVDAGRVQKKCPECDVWYTVSPEKCPTCKGLDWQPTRGPAGLRRHVDNTEQYADAQQKAAAGYDVVTLTCVHPVAVAQPEDEPPDGLTPPLEEPCGHLASLRCLTCGPLCFDHATDHGCPPENLGLNAPMARDDRHGHGGPTLEWVCKSCLRCQVSHAVYGVPDDRVCRRCKTPAPPRPEVDPALVWHCSNCHQKQIDNPDNPNSNTEARACWRCSPRGCGNCRYFYPDHERVGVGTCRFRPVQLTSWPCMPKDGVIIPDFAIQPATDYVGWCGEWDEGPPPIPLPKPEPPAPKSRLIVPGR